MGELLQIRFSSHADAAGYEVVPFSPKVQFRKQFRVLVILAIGQHSFYDLALSLPFGIVHMFFIQPLEYLFADLFQKPLFFLRQVYPILFIPIFDVDAASGSLCGIDGVMQREALYVVFDCAPAHAELESEILYLVVSSDTDRFPDGAASFVCRHPDLDLLCRFVFL